MDNPSNPAVSPMGSSPLIGSLLRHPQLPRVLLANPGREFTVRELANESRTAYATAWRLVGLLRDLGAVHERRIGATRAVSLNLRSPLVPELRRLLRIRLEPHREAAKRFARLAAPIQGVRRVVLFGSAAHGAATPSSDVDIAVIIDRRSADVLARIDEVAARIQDETGLKVVAIPLDPRESDGHTRLAEAVRAGEVLHERP